jgi:hypothetical protein
LLFKIIGHIGTWPFGEMLSKWSPPVSEAVIQFPVCIWKHFNWTSASFRNWRHSWLHSCLLARPAVYISSSATSPIVSATGARSSQKCYCEPVIVAVRSSPAHTYGSWRLIPLEAWMFVCVSSVFVLSCVGSGLATGWSPVQGVLPTVYNIHSFQINSDGNRPEGLIYQGRRWSVTWGALCSGTWCRVVWKKSGEFIGGMNCLHFQGRS